MPLTYQLPNGHIVYLPDSVLEIFHKHRQTRFKISESGGILLGRIYESKMRIEMVTTPGKGDRQGPLFFHRNRARAQRLVDNAFDESNGEQTYLGEWHSHNEKNPHPSWKDKTEIEAAFRKSKLHVNFILCIIVGSQDTLGNLWVGFLNRCGMQECTIYAGTTE